MPDTEPQTKDAKPETKKVTEKESALIKIIGEKIPHPRSRDLSEKVFAIIPNVMQAIRHDMRNTVKGLTIPQFRILGRLESGSTNHRDLAEWVGVSLPAISRMISLLEDRDLVVRDRQRKDRRYVHLTLSEKGMEFFRRCKKKGQKSFAQRLSHLDAESVDTIIKGLNILGDAVRHLGVEDEK